MLLGIRGTGLHSELLQNPLAPRATVGRKALPAGGHQKEPSCRRMPAAARSPASEGRRPVWVREQLSARCVSAESQIPSCWCLETLLHNPCSLTLGANGRAFLREGLDGPWSRAPRHVRSKGVCLFMCRSVVRAEMGFGLCFQENDNAFPCVNFPTTTLPHRAVREHAPFLF